MVWGQMNFMIKPSRFIYEMKQDNLEYLSEKFSKFTKKMEKSTVIDSKRKTKIENFNPFAIKSVRTQDLKHRHDLKYKVGDKVTHIKFGKGKIKSMDSKSMTVDFAVGEKKIALVLVKKILKDE